MAKDFIFSDINLKFLPTPKGDVSKIYDENSIIQGIKNAILIGQEEIPFNDGTRGTRIYDLLFEPLDIDVAYEIRDEILTVIENNITRISNIDVSVMLYEKEDAYLINITFIPDTNKEPVKVEHILRRIR